MERFRFTGEQQALMEGMQIPFAVFQLVDGKIVTLVLSDGFCELLEAPDRAQAHADMDHNTYTNVHPDDVARIRNTVFRFMRDGGRFESIYRLKKRSGSGYILIHANGKHVYTQTGERLAYIWYTDEGMYSEESGRGTELSRSLSKALHEESLFKASCYDSLTGLPSMTYFFELAQDGKREIAEAGGNAALLFIDLSGMKYYNQKHGFTEGDNYLRAFAGLLAKAFGEEKCCHFGQDHFGAFAREENLEEALRRFFGACREAFGESMLPVKVGIFSARGEDVPVSTACDRAKLACDALKGTYASDYRFYNQELSDDAERKQYVIGNLDRAIREKWIQVYYQPIIRAVTERVCDEEALARWIDPVRGFMSPAEFIPALEDAGLIYKLDLYVLDQVLEKINDQKKTGLHIVPHSINLSRSDFNACDIVEEIRKRVDAAGVSRDRITIEITESVIGRDFGFMKSQVERFRSYGFPVWMDDFGSGYSSLDVLQSIKFDLIKFDMSFMRKLDEGDSGKIILTELMKMATSLGVDTVCEGVETESQVRFLQEIGCSKLQGFYFCKAIPLEEIVERNRKGIQIGYENPGEASYYETIGRLNLYDLDVIASEDVNAFQNIFNTLPMAILEIRDGEARYARSNRSYREFMERFFDMDLTGKERTNITVPIGYGMTFVNAVKQCCKSGNRMFFDEQMPDGSIVHSFVRRIGWNPITGRTAVAIAVLSVTEQGEGATYAGIARALAADYYNIYVVDLDSERFIEYTSPVGGEELAIARHGTDFFASARRDTMTRIYEEDREAFLACFSKEKVVRDLDEQGVFTATYRLIDTGKPIYASMKITRMYPGGSRIIVGISIIEAQMRQREQIQEMQRERETLTRVVALSEDYLSLYTVDPATGRYLEYSATEDYRSLGFAGEGEDFFLQGVIDGKRTVWPEDLPRYLQGFTRENVMRELREKGVFKLQYRLIIHGEPCPVSLKIAPFKDGNTEKLVAGVRAWRTRR